MERYRHRYERFVAEIFEEAEDRLAELRRWLRERFDRGPIGDPENFIEEIFGEIDQGGGVGIRVLRSPDAPINRRLALVSTHEDDVLIVPGLVAIAADDTEFRERLGGLGFAPDRGDQREDAEFSGGWLDIGQSSAEQAAPGNGSEAIPERETAVYFYEGDADTGDLERARAVLRTVAEFSSSGVDGSPRLAPVYGFVGSQRIKPAADYELPSASTVVEPAAVAANGRVIHVLDTGLTADPAIWKTPRITTASTSGADREPSTPPNQYLPWGAGHGTFVASIAHQVSPATTVVAHRVASLDGLLTEASVTARLNLITALADPYPVVVMSFGGYEIGASSTGTAPLPANQRWAKMPLLQAAVLRFLKAKPGGLIVAAAGNENTNVRCFPAAFSGFEGEAAKHHESEPWWGRVVSVGATDAQGCRAPFSNFGPWVSATALGMDITSLFVTGRENPAHELDDSGAEVFEGFARGSGTSFAAPIVAAAIVNRAVAAGTSPAQAWEEMRADASSVGRAVVSVSDAP